MWAHPRSRGENRFRSLPPRCRRGSSPLTRGKPDDRDYRCNLWGLIPAHAGKTTKTNPTTDPNPGSSPLTRGKPIGTKTPTHPVGLIPAHAGKTLGVVGRRTSQGAHPRSRGENASAASAKLPTEGSSPLTRGKHLLTRQGHVLERLIPAHAGKTRAVVVLVAMIWAHPRSRGENTGGGGLGSHDLGSSPLTRGKRARNRVGQLVPGLIPAHAGKTPGGGLRPSTSEAHPRSRGENYCIPIVGLCIAGSSPLTRGKLKHRGQIDRRRRLIPAHAGKTSVLSCLVVDMRAHPRSRGENQWKAVTGEDADGSSPLTRGKLKSRDIARDIRGLIPAHAGKTGAGSPPTSDRRAHPRSRGENPQVGTKNPGGEGSSPLTRGKRGPGGGGAPRHGLIPAHAGKTYRRGAEKLAARAHPRSRGENQALSHTTHFLQGSSPLTRGKPEVVAALISVIGLIPAHAGKTFQAELEMIQERAHPRSRGENDEK